MTKVLLPDEKERQATAPFLKVIFGLYIIIIVVDRE
jgi:hypothetical protein